MTREQKQHILHFAVSSLGGFMGGYAIYNHCDVFGNAQTANMIHLVSKIFTGDFEGVVFIVIALLTYILGNVFFVISDRFIKLETKTVSLIASAVALLIIGIFPNISNNYLAILPILFVTPVLWNYSEQPEVMLHLRFSRQTTFVLQLFQHSRVLLTRTRI